MRQYDIYKSEGGYRVACVVHLGCPDVDSSPWYKTKAAAESYRNIRIKERIAYIEGEDFPPSMKKREIEALRKLLKRQTYYVLSGEEGARGSWRIAETGDIKRLLRKERCGGDRWAKAYKKSECYRMSDGFGVAGVNVETGNLDYVTGEAADDFLGADGDEG